MTRAWLYFILEFNKKLGSFRRNWKYKV